MSKDVNRIMRNLFDDGAIAVFDSDGDSKEPKSKKDDWKAGSYWFNALKPKITFSVVSSVLLFVQNKPTYTFDRQEPWLATSGCGWKLKL